MKELKKIDINTYELILQSEESLSAKELEEYNLSGYILFNVIRGVEWDEENSDVVEYRDIYYFRKAYQKELNVADECIGVDITLTLYFDMLNEALGASEQEVHNLKYEIIKILDELNELPSFSKGKVTVTTTDADKVNKILKRFGW